MEPPKEFLTRMKSMLGSEYEDFLKAYSLPAFRGLRVNTLKCSIEEFKKLSPVQLNSTPFSPEGFYINGEIGGRHPLHHAGAFYFQEPSAMAPVTTADIKAGMRVLDLCAAPGGKSTQAAAALQGSGLLVSNEIVPSRAKILMSNIERCGVRNAVVTNESPEKLCAALRGFFDVVLVDAPCSGEGMFRREPQSASEWREGSPAACAIRQKSILDSAKNALKEGGVLVYSTCTFSPEENEGVIDLFLKNNIDFEIEDIRAEFGRAARPEWALAMVSLQKARRIFPSDGGEGHFVAKLRKQKSESCGVTRGAFSIPKAEREIFEKFYKSQFDEVVYGTLHFAGSSVYILPDAMPQMNGIRLVRAGILAGRVKSGRFEPEHSLYMAAKEASLRNACFYSAESPELAAFLHGEAIAAPERLNKGYAAVGVENFTIGFGKVTDGVIKNHYPKGLRNLK